ncbi:hypothetical protein [Amycolatopsis benzoatilytica]|uniref:hypothetical protein n=1 Tax=Amycolatopsis benzoatilytica TaxID=346045 RepID=UPI00037C6523|nr:hypothetical protein [Amycolatopsis benzoatilytica]
MITQELEDLAAELTNVLDSVAAAFGASAVRTVNGELDCDPAQPGHLVCWQYGLRLEGSPGAPRRLSEAVRPTLEAAGWKSYDRSTYREVIARFSRDGADFSVHIARDGRGVAIIGSTRCVTA